MKRRMLSLALVLFMALSIQPVGALAADETLFERYIPINQAYSAQINPFTVEVGSSCNFFVGTQFKDENGNMTFDPPLKRKDLQGDFLKINYEGTFGSLDKDKMMKAFSLAENDYLLAMGDSSANRY